MGKICVNDKSYLKTEEKRKIGFEETVK